jgi:hypothetical protein
LGVPAEVHLPDPVKQCGRLYWWLSEIINYERALEGKPPIEMDPAEDRRLTARKLRERWGGISNMTLYRRRFGVSRQPKPARQPGETTQCE